MSPEFNTIYKGKIFQVVTWEGKKGIMFEAAVRSPGVRLLIETQKGNTKALLMTKEIRHEVGGIDYRLPGGKVFDNFEEFDVYRNSKKDIFLAAEAAAKKEGREEAGIFGGKYIALEVSKAGATIEWDLYYFKVTGAKIGEPKLEESEKGDIETIVLSAEEIFDKLLNKQIKEGRSAAILWMWLQDNGFIKFISTGQGF